MVDEHPQSNIELAAFKQQWSLDILLDDEDLRMNILLQVDRWPQVLRLVGFLILNLRHTFDSGVRPLVLEYLTASTVDLEFGHFRAGRVFFKELPELLETIEEADAAASVIITRLDEPDVATVKHGFTEAESSRKEVPVLNVRGKVTVLGDLFVDVVCGAAGILDALNRVEVRAEAVDFHHVLRTQVNNELRREERENVDFGRLGVPLHILK